MRRRLAKLKLWIAINEPSVLKRIGENSVRKADRLTMRDVDRITSAASVKGRKRSKKP